VLWHFLLTRALAGQLQQPYGEQRGRHHIDRQRTYRRQPVGHNRPFSDPLTTVVSGSFVSLVAEFSFSRYQTHFGNFPLPAFAELHFGFVPEIAAITRGAAGRLPLLVGALSDLVFAGDQFV
jgi:hypothetical protein